MAQNCETCENVYAILDGSKKGRIMDFFYSHTVRLVTFPPIFEGRCRYIHETHIFRCGQCKQEYQIVDDKKFQKQYAFYGFVNVLQKHDTWDYHPDLKLLHKKNILPDVGDLLIDYRYNQNHGKKTNVK